MPARPARISSAGQLALELPLELPPIALAPEWKDQQRLWGHAFHPMCSYLASFPAALTHAFIARYSRPRRRRPRPVLRPRHDAAPGLRRGSGRRRQRPQPVRPPADRGQGRAGDPRRRRRPGLPRSGSPGTPDSAGWLALGERVIATRRHRTRSCRSPGRGGSPADGVEPVPAEVALAFHPRTLGQLLFVRTTLRLDDRDRPVPRRRADRDPPRQERELPVRAHAEHVQHGAALRPRLRRPDRVRVARARRLRRPRQEARPAVPPAAAHRSRASRCWATRATSRRAPGRPCGPAACPSGPASS